MTTENDFIIQQQISKNFETYLYHLGIKRKIQNFLTNTDYYRSEHPDLRYTQIPLKPPFNIWQYSRFQPKSRQNSLCEFNKNCVDAWDLFDFHKEQKIKQPICFKDSSDGLNLTRLLKYYNQIGERYEDSLELDLKKIDIKILPLNNLPLTHFKNNLFALHPSMKNITKKKIKDISYLANNTDIFIIDNTTYQIIQRHEIKPHITTYEDSIRSSFSETPHSINFIKTGTIQFSQEEEEDHDILACCCEDGRTLIYDISTEKLKLIIELITEQSAWGIDFYKDIICISDNSHKITIFGLKDVIKEGYVWFTQSMILENNIPDLKIQKYQKGIIRIICVTISSEIIFLEFKIIEEKLHTVKYKPHFGEDGIIRVNITQILNEGYEFSVNCLQRLVMNDCGWSVNIMKSSEFMDVFNPEYLGTIESMIPNDQDIYERSYLLQQNLPSSEKNKKKHLYCSNLGIAANFEQSMTLIKPPQTNDTYPDFPGINFIDEAIYMNFNFQKIEKALLKKNDEKDSYYIITTESKILLLNSEFCLISFTPSLFNIMPYIEDLPEISIWHNRLSIVKSIPHLSLILVISQMGILTGFRLVNYRGIKTLRQEFCIPEKINNAEDYERIVGCDWKLNGNEGKVIVSIILGETGTVKRFELSEKQNEELDVTWL